MNILILNLHSALNLGDDAIMIETLQSLRIAFPESTITIAANDPASWRKYDHVQVIGSLTTWVVNSKDGRWRWQKPLLLWYAGLITLTIILYCLFHVRLLFGSHEQRKLLSAYYNANVVLSCGGGNFYAHRSISPGLIWSSLTLALAIFFGKKVVMLPQSIGPIKGKFQRLLMRTLLNHISLIMLRENRSLSLLNELGVRQPAIVLADLAFGHLPTVDTPLLAQLANDGSLRIGVTVLDWAAQEKSFHRQEIYENAIVSLFTKLSHNYKIHGYIFVQCYGPTIDQDDRYIAQRIYQRLLKETNQVQVTLLDTFKGALEIRTLYKQMDCMIGTRMHTGIFCLSQAVPIVLIGYQPKAYGIMELFGLERFCCNIETMTEDELSKIVGEALENRAELKKHMTERYIHVQKLLGNWVGYLKD